MPLLSVPSVVMVISSAPKESKPILRKSTPSSKPALLKTSAKLSLCFGLSQYVSRFIPDYSTITAPLRALTRTDAEWKWTTDEQTSLNNLKAALTGQNVMSYFDQNKPTEIIVDASPVGLAALRVRPGKVISYASRALSDVESRYSQTEREMLAVV